MPTRCNVIIKDYYKTIKRFRDYVLYSIDNRYGICYVDYKNTKTMYIVDHNGLYFNDEVEQIFNNLTKNDIT